MRILFFLTLLLSLMSCSDSTNPKLRPVEDLEVKESTDDIEFLPALDILFIVDDSGSMSSHQQNLSNNIGRFVESIMKVPYLDYHIGVIRASMMTNGLGKLSGSPRYIDRTTPDGMSKLAANILVGTSGDATERFFEPGKLALSTELNKTNVGFYRPQAFLAIFMITDTDDQSAIEAADFYKFLVDLKKSTNRLFVSAAFIPEAEMWICEGESEGVGTKLEEFFALTDASTFSLCEVNFGQKLGIIGQILARKAQTLYLNKLPLIGTISVSMGGITIPEDADIGWSYNPVINSIEFGLDIDWNQFPVGSYPEVNFDPVPL